MNMNINNDNSNNHNIDRCQKADSVANIRIGIFGSCPTTGDEAIAIGLCILIRDIWPFANLKIYSDRPELYRSILKWVECTVKSPLAVPNSSFPAYKKKLSALGLLFQFRAFNDVHIFSQISKKYAQEIDLVFLQGGPSWSTPNLYRTRSLLINAMKILALRRSGIKIISIGQSFGPFPSISGLRFWLNRRLFRLIIESIDIIVPRDMESVQVIMECSKQKPELGFDTALMLESRDNPDESEKRNMIQISCRKFLNKKIGLSVRDFQQYYGYQDVRSGYLNEFASLVDWLYLQGYEIFWIPTDFDGSYGKINDLQMIKEVLSRCTSSVVTSSLPNDALDPEQIITLSKKIDFLVSTRLHPIILASLSGVPAISIAYDQKCSRFMNQIGLGQYVIGLSDFNLTITKKKIQEIELNNLKLRAQITTAVASMQSQLRMLAQEILLPIEEQWFKSRK